MSSSIERILDIFEAFQASQRPLSLTALAAATGMPKSSCHALVSTLSRRGYLYSLSRPKAFYPTRRMYDAAIDIVMKDPFIEQVMPSLERLRDESGETIIMGKRQGHSAVYLQVVESLQSICYSAKPGDIKPLHSSAIGKAILGALSNIDLQDWVEERDFMPITASTLTAPTAFISELSQSRLKGYFQSRGENVTDVWAVAAPLKIRKEIFSIAVAGPQHRIEPKLKKIAQQLNITAGLIVREFNESVVL
jgi:IclR family acetate operon transcriptional repressor|tara:strand:+ start:2830 stop:3579 length:750 start_codon:yes stop_codon:yes gene_type:complete